MAPLNEERQRIYNRKRGFDKIEIDVWKRNHQSDAAAAMGIKNKSALDCEINSKDPTLVEKISRRSEFLINPIFFLY